eukprot:GDKH01002187.1.p1 GENE.GDKH01002187.1~~GDKH01002187.1.p1  ORF type:complete len:137 (-),score=18.23 GDKH01002187.1:94-504(-)
MFPNGLKASHLLAALRRTPQLLPRHAAVTSRFAHKFAAPPCPNLNKLRSMVWTKFYPIHFELQNDYNYGTHIYDTHFKGILCSPKFEGKTYAEMNRMFNEECFKVGLKKRVKMHCEPPSRFLKMKKFVRHHWNMER